MFIAGSPGWSQGAVSGAVSSEETVDVSKAGLPHYDDSRVLVESTRLLREWFGWRISYEDPRLGHASDIKDVSNELRAGARPGLRAFRANAHPFQFNLPRSEDWEPDRFETLDRMVKAYNSSGNPGRFAWFHEGGFSHIVPVMVKDKATGKWVPSPSILDTPVTPDGKEKTLEAAVTEVLAQVERRIKRTIWIGNIPTNLSRQVNVQLPSRSTTAREAFVEMFSQVIQNRVRQGSRLIFLTWHIRYAIKDDLYTFNVGTLKPTSPDAPTRYCRLATGCGGQPLFHHHSCPAAHGLAPDLARRSQVHCCDRGCGGAIPQ